MGFKRIAKIGALCLALYSGYSFLNYRIAYDRIVDIEPGKSYSILAVEPDSFWFPFSMNRAYFNMLKIADGKNIRGYQCAEIKRWGNSREFQDNNFDGMVDSISFKEDGISVKLNRNDNFETHGEDFIFGDNYLKQTKERFKDLISEVERKAGFKAGF